MKKLLSIGVIAGMLFLSACSNDDAQVDSVSKLKNENFRGPTQPDPNMDEVTEFIQGIADGMNEDRFIPPGYRLCGQEINVFGGLIGYEIGQFGGIRFIVRYSSLDGNPPYNPSWEICHGNECNCPY